jgi:hypothetical protein
LVSEAELFMTLGLVLGLKLIESYFVKEAVRKSYFDSNFEEG